jgi:hypothetical protein
MVFPVPVPVRCRGSGNGNEEGRSAGLGWRAAPGPGQLEDGEEALTEGGASR